MRRILWFSNGPHVQSGYGAQTALFTQHMQREGWEPIIAAFYGLRGSRLKGADGIEVLPGAFHEFGEDLLQPHYEHYRPDALVLLIDIWVYSAEILSSLPVTSWCPVDHNPIPPAVLRNLRQCKHIWAMSRFGECLMRRAGLDPAYVPHGVDTQVFQPGDRDHARRRLGIDDGRFVAVMVAANKGYPDRKSIRATLKAWAKFIQTHPDALLVLHTNPFTIHGGVDVAALQRFYGIPDHNLMLPDVYRMLRGDMGGAYMNALFNTADVKLLPSAGEGFGVPVIEAQAAGCPVIVSDFTAQSELAGPGYAIPVTWDDTLFTPQGAEQVLMRPSAILTALEWAVDHQGDGRLRAESRDFAMEYDSTRVWRDFMRPALERQFDTSGAKPHAKMTTAS